MSTAIARAHAAHAALVAHPLDLPPTALSAGKLVITAITAALWQDRVNRGLPIPDGGLVALLDTALDAWELDVPDAVRVEAAYAVALAALS